VRRTDLLQTEDERLGALNLVDLPSLAHRLLDDVAVIVVILQRGKKEKRETAAATLRTTSVHTSARRAVETPPPYPHVLFEDVGARLHVHHAEDDQFAVGGEEVSPLVQSFDLQGLVVLLPI